MLNYARYRGKWQKQREEYIASGVVPAEPATLDDDRVLVVSGKTPECGIDSQKNDVLLRDVELGKKR